MDNLVIESGEIANVEITDEFLLLEFKAVSAEGNEMRNIMGFFLHSYQDTPRELICQLIKQHWEIAMMDRNQTQAQSGVVQKYADGGFGSSEVGGDHKPIGRRLSLSELFQQR